MFERRLKIFLGILILFTGALVLRAGQKQVMEHAVWDELADKAGKRSPQLETRRGAIRDVKGVVIAADEDCFDACVDYRALVPSPLKDGVKVRDRAREKWIQAHARSRLVARLGGTFTDAPLERRKEMLAAEVEAVNADLADMIPRLAQMAGVEEATLEEARIAVVEKVQIRQRRLWYTSYENELKRHNDVLKAQTQPSSLWEKWLLEEDEEAPDLDSFYVPIQEATAKHVLIRNLDLDVRTELSKRIDRFPGLEIRPGNRRMYPLGAAAEHIIGRLAPVVIDDLKYDLNKDDDSRAYQHTDLKGRGGLEGLCEPVLRGVRGKVDIVKGNEVGRVEPQPGQDVFASIDVELQAEVEELFERVPIKVPGQKDPDLIAMHGAAVVIDVATGEVRVMASAPGFDPNRYDEEYALHTHPSNLERPLLNRATQAPREPGSTVKPIVGMAAVASGIRRADEGYECTGYMVVNGRYFKSGRCWVTSMFHADICGPNCKVFPCPNVAHHQQPSYAKHPTGWLTLADALERSCNPYFESIAHAMGAQRLSDWYRNFGLGTKTYIGIAESSGLVPVNREGKGPKGLSGMLSTWFAGIGQGPVHATPLQMANVAATIARDGVWVRPKLLRGKRGESDRSAQLLLPPTTQLADQVDLHIPPLAIAAVREGMYRVVHTRAGSGKPAWQANVVVCGKTGTAEAAPVQIDLVDPKTGKPVPEMKDGKPVLDRKGKPKYMKTNLKISNPGDINPDAKWYRGTGHEGGKPHHSWFMGYAPAEKPEIAFAVLVEYGGSGGAVAGSVAGDIVKLCVAHGYLKTSPHSDAVASPIAPPAEVELLRDLPTTTGPVH